MQAIDLGERRALHASWAAGFRVAPKATRRGPGRMDCGWELMGTHAHTRDRHSAHTHIHTHGPNAPATRTYLRPPHIHHHHTITTPTLATHTHDIRISDAGETC